MKILLLLAVMAFIGCAPADDSPKQQATAKAKKSTCCEGK